MISNQENDMEEGEISDDGMDLPEVVERPPKMDVVPDILKEIGGADFNMVDQDTVQKISARALRFQTGKAISFQEISHLYSSLEISQNKENSLDRLETIHVWSPDRLDLPDVQRYFSEYHPLNVELVAKNRANVIWATPANCARALLAVSKGIGEASTERVIKHVLDDGEAKSIVTETDVGEDFVHPEDIGIELPEGGPWRLGKRPEEEGVLLLRFGRKTDISMEERRATVRSVGILSKSKREELLMEQQKAAERELEMKKPVDKKNPWGIVAERWAGESRGQTGRAFDDYMDSLDKGLTLDTRSSRKDWDAPDEAEYDGRRTARGRGSIRDRLDFNNRVEEDSDDQAETFMEADEEEIDWAAKMKRPRMGMVADLVEKKGSVKSRLYASENIKRKVPNSRYNREEEEEMESSIVRRVDIEERVFKTAGRRLTDRFMGGRLEGRVGLGKSDKETTQTGRSMGGRLGGKFESRLGMKNNASDSEDSLERDDGTDLQQNLENDLVIQVTQSDEEFETQRSERRGNKPDLPRRELHQDIEQRIRSKDKHSENYRLRKSESRDKEKIKALKEREEQLLREKRRQERRDREREKEEYLRRKEKEKKRSKKKYSSDEDSDSESDESDSDSSESSDSDSNTSGSDSESSSSDSQEETSRKKKIVSKKQKAESKKHRDGASSSKSYKDQTKSESKKKSSKKDSEEELRKAEELRDKLKNYLKKAKEAKENRKK